MRSSLIKLVPRKFLPWGSIWCGTVLLLMGTALFFTGYFLACHEAAQTPGESNLGAAVLLIMFEMPAVLICVLGALSLILGLSYVAYRSIASRRSIQAP